MDIYGKPFFCQPQVITCRFTLGLLAGNGNYFVPIRENAIIHLLQHIVQVCQLLDLQFLHFLVVFIQHYNLSQDQGCHCKRVLKSSVEKSPVVTIGIFTDVFKCTFQKFYETILDVCILQLSFKQCYLSSNETIIFIASNCLLVNGNSIFFNGFKIYIH